MAVLHTWDQMLRLHLHLHCIIPAGALSSDAQHWFPTRYSDFLFPVKALSEVFRGKFIHNLKKTFSRDKLIFPGQAARFESEKEFQDLIEQLWQTNWVVYSKKPFAGPQQVFDYLGRYTHRVAISNNRIKNIEDNSVIFSYRDRRDNNRLKECTLPAEQFISRFLLHVLPGSYFRLRYFGFLSNSFRQKNISLCRTLLGLSGKLPEIQKKTAEQLLLQLTGKDVTKCPLCRKGTLVTTRILPGLFIFPIDTEVQGTDYFNSS